MLSDKIPTILIHRALRRLLRPLVKALVGHGVVFPAVVELLRELYVDVANDEFLVEGKEQTLSRINLMTGVTRREIKRLLSSEREADAPPRSLSLSARIMTIWLGNEAYLDGQGKPLPLPLTAADDEPSLERLVSSVSKDVRARAVLDEWLRLGVVEMSGYIIRLKASAFIPEEGYDEKVYYFGRNLRDHIAAGVHNLSEEGPPFFDRAVYYDNLSTGSLDELRDHVKEHGTSFILEMNRKARALADQDEISGERLSGRMTIGVYHFAEDEDHRRQDPLQRTSTRRPNSPAHQDGMDEET